MTCAALASKAWNVNGNRHEMLMFVVAKGDRMVRSGHGLSVAQDTLYEPSKNDKVMLAKVHYLARKTICNTRV